jgi:predicted Fe-Mo cluster-binding NifX family protein
MTRAAAPVENNAGLKSIISQVAARSPYIAIVDIVNGLAKDVKVLENPASMSGGGAGYMLAQWLKENNVSVFLAPNIGPNLAQGLAASGITILQAPPGRTLEEALRALKLIT